MAEPAKKLETQFARIIAADLDMRWSSAVDIALKSRGLSLVDLHNALSNCEVLSSNKMEAEGVTLEAIGMTTEDVLIRARVYVNLDQGYFRVESIS
jgi:hypothetical protein